MGIQYLSYLDIPVERRTEKGLPLLNELRRSLGQPGLREDQRQAITARINRIVDWINGTMDAVDPAVPHCEPTRAASPPSLPDPVPPHPQPVDKKADKKADKNPVIEVDPEEEPPEVQ